MPGPGKALGVGEGRGAVLGDTRCLMEPPFSPQSLSPALGGGRALRCLIPRQP